MTDTEVISMTPNAARRVAEIATKLGKDPVLRLSVEGGGCSGSVDHFAVLGMLLGTPLTVTPYRSLS